MRKLLALVLVLGMAGGVMAQNKEKKAPASPEEAFKRLDKNSDGSLSADEYMGKPKDDAAKSKKEASFKRLDKNGDGKLSLEEFKAGAGKKKAK